MAFTHPNPYVDAEELRAQLGPQVFLAIFDDDNVGTASEDAVAQVCARASGRVDGHLRKVYADAVVPFQGDPPLLAKEGALEFAVGMSYLRHPEYAARYGEKGKVDEFIRAEKLCSDLALNLQRLAPGPAAAPDPANVSARVDFGSNDDAFDGVGGGIFRDGFGDF